MALLLLVGLLVFFGGMILAIYQRMRNGAPADPSEPAALIPAPEGGERAASAIEIQVERTRAELAEGRVESLTNEREELTLALARSAVATKERDLLRGRAEEAERRVASDAPVLAWAVEAISDDARPVANNLLTVEEATCTFENMWEKVGAHITIKVRFRHHGLFPVTIGEDYTGYLMYGHGRFPLIPEVHSVHAWHGSAATLSMFQPLVNPSEGSAIQEALDADGTAKLRGHVIRLSIRGQRPDGSEISEWIALPDEIPGTKP